MKKEKLTPEQLALSRKKAVETRKANAQKRLEKKIAEGKDPNADSLSKVVTMRFTEDDFRILSICAHTLGLTPSRYIRLLVNPSIVSYKDYVKQGVIADDNLKTVLDN